MKPAGPPPVLKWIVLGAMIALLLYAGQLSWTYYTIRNSSDAANKACASVKPGTPAEEVAARFKAMPGAEVAAEADTVSAEFGRCLCYVPIADGRAAEGIQVGCRF